MKNSKSTIDELKDRREKIVNLLSTLENHSSTVRSLAKNFRVSEMTMRRDLTFLEDHGFIRRFHGGAKLLEETEANNSNNSIYVTKIKQEIAKKAAEYIDEYSTIYINSGDTALNVVDYIDDLNLVIVSNNLNIYKKKINSNTTTILTGGEIRAPRDVLVGDSALNSLSTIHADIAILSCSGVSAKNGVSTNNIHEARVNKTMIENSRHLVILVADYQKIGQSTNFIVDNLSNIDILITDIYADKEEIRKIEELGVDVVQVDV